ncbi:MAG: hypothetical protein SPH68_02875, partial [Candidatus Borkfalkiaceae bacterium]|nr:hypothetical protein [Clostridia bacterium]MDY6223091.1 hypothetical protein [Christensenellaceae bacterium]
ININKLENCEVQLAIAAIDNLPAVSEVEPYHKTAIDKVRAACDSLTAEQLGKVTNYATLTALETAFNEKFEVVVEMTAENNGYLARPATWLGTNYTIGYSADETYGNLIVMNPVAKVTEAHNAFECTLTDALDATKYDKVCFYVYNGSDSDKGLFVRFDGGTYIPSFMTLKSGWNKVEMTVEQFNTLNILGIGSVSQTSAVYKFSDIYAVKKTSAG